MTNVLFVFLLKNNKKFIIHNSISVQYVDWSKISSCTVTPSTDLQNFNKLIFNEHLKNIMYNMYKLYIQHLNKNHRFSHLWQFENLVHRHSHFYSHNFPILFCKISRACCIFNKNREISRIRVLWRIYAWGWLVIIRFASILEWWIKAYWTNWCCMHLTCFTLSNVCKFPSVFLSYTVSQGHWSLSQGSQGHNRTPFHKLWTI